MRPLRRSPPWCPFWRGRRSSGDGPYRSCRVRPPKSSPKTRSRRRGDPGSARCKSGLRRSESFWHAGDVTPRPALDPKRPSMEPYTAVVLVDRRTIHQAAGGAYHGRHQRGSVTSSVSKKGTRCSSDSSCLVRAGGSGRAPAVNPPRCSMFPAGASSGWPCISPPPPTWISEKVDGTVSLSRKAFLSRKTFIEVLLSSAPEPPVAQKLQRGIPRVSGVNRTISYAGPSRQGTVVGRRAGRRRNRRGGPRGRGFGTGAVPVRVTRLRVAVVVARAAGVERRHPRRASARVGWFATRLPENRERQGTPERKVNGWSPGSNRRRRAKSWADVREPDEARPVQATDVGTASSLDGRGRHPRG